MGGTEKVACWRTKAAISLERVKIEEKLLLTAYRNSPTLFRTVPSPTLYGLPFPHQRSFKWHHSRPSMASSSSKLVGLQLSYPLLSRELVKPRTSNLAHTFTGPIRIKVHLKFWKKGAWALGISRDCPIFLGTPYYFRNG